MAEEKGWDNLTQLWASHIHRRHLSPGVEAGVVTPHLPAGRAIRKLSSCQIQSGIWKGRGEIGEPKL